MIDHPALIFLFLVAVGFVVAIHQDRKAHDRERLDKRLRLFQGGDI